MNTVADLNITVHKNDFTHDALTHFEGYKFFLNIVRRNAECILPALRQKRDLK